MMYLAVGRTFSVFRCTRDVASRDAGGMLQDVADNYVLPICSERLRSKDVSVTSLVLSSGVRQPLTWFIEFSLLGSGISA